MIEKIMHRIVFFILCLVNILGYAQTAVITSPLANAAPIFDAKDANTKFDRLNLKLSTKGLDPVNLTSALKTLNKLSNQAEDCVRINEKKIATIDTQIKEATLAVDKTELSTNIGKSSADLVYLNTERKNLSGVMAQCRLFAIRAKEAIDVYETTLNKLKKEEILARGDTLWAMISKLESGAIIKTKVRSNILSIPEQFSGIHHLWMFLGLSIFVALLVFYKAYSSKKVRHYIHLRRFYPASFILLTFSIFSLSITAYLGYMLYKQIIVSDLLIYLSSIVSVYLLMVFIIIVLFNVKKIKAFFCWNSLDSEFFKYLIIFLFSFYTLSITTKLLSDELKINEVAFDIGQSLFLYVELLMSICFAYYFCKTHQQIIFIKKYKKYIQHSCALVFVFCGVMNVFGYHSLSIHMTFFGISTFAIIFSAVLIEQAIGKLYEICVTDERVRAKMIEIFGYKQEQTFTEIFILKLMLQIVVFVMAVYLISKSWSYANDYIDTIMSYVFDGIKFETFTFHPTRVVTGVIVFCIFYLIFRSISTSITRHAQFDGEEETQVAIASILIYLGFTVALVSALLIAGFDFTGLAIVAGALSVGIGLGLQSIVNNFVSGIILLIEKPIKTGDRINIDGVEGVVKKIRVRSTQILTATREDMIIPNSDLITHRVTNYMYSDKKLTIYCEVGIAYGSDILRARDLLIEIANRHSEIIKNDKNNKPRVFLRSFGENSMLFQLWFLIRDGNHKILVRSEIYFEIERVFRENNIIIAFPQRKIHFNLDNLNGIKDIK